METNRQCSRSLWLSVALVALLSSRDLSAQTVTSSDIATVPQSPLSFHRRNYVISSFDETDSIKFQLSLKYRLLKLNLGREHPHVPPSGVYLAYTQLVIWDAFDIENSSPMKDINFGPEIFYLHSLASVRDDGCNVHDFQLGASHNSNGRRAPETRSVNLFVGTIRAGCSLAKRSGPLGSVPHGVLELTAWTPPFIAFENPDITRYMGYGQLELTLSSGLVAQEENARQALAGIFGSTIAVRVGTAGYVTVKWEGSYRPPYPRALRFLPYLMVQYFNGYGETLLTYQQKSKEFRVGLGL